MTFKISEHVDFDTSGRAVCPSCAQEGKDKKRNLALVPDTDGAYKCHRGCTTEDIRQALGIEKSRAIPTALAPQTPPKKTQVTPQEVKAAHQRLMTSDGPAKKWLQARGISEEMMKHHKLGIVRVKIGKLNTWAISIPILAAGGTTYHIKKRVAPWDEAAQQLDGYQPWKQYGIPKMVYFAHKPEGATATWLCEGEWDAMRLAEAIRDSETMQRIAIASFTCGCSSVPDDEQLKELPGKVTVFYDRNDTPLKNGIVPGDAGAEKAALALGDRGQVARVPMQDDCQVKGWDVSDAINAGHTLIEFMEAVEVATKPTLKKNSSNSLINALRWNDELVDSAADYTEFLVPDLLTEDELFLLAAGPRIGKSLLAMTLALAVATGGQFMGRPVNQGTVIYVKCEDSDTKIKERQQAQGWSRGLPVAWLNDFKLSNMDELEELVAELDPRLLVLDTLSRIKDSPVSESSAEMSQILEPLQRMANKYGVCVLLVHHTGKINVENLGKIDIFDTIRGSSAIRAVCRGSMVIAKGENEYRLVVENGWGQHDLKVVLDANTLRWQQLGKWAPATDMTQQEQIIDTLKKLGSASIEQLHAETGIKKKCLYEQVSRLVNSEEAASQLVKEGSRRNYTYRLALFNTIQQLNSVLNSANPAESSAIGYSQQNINSSDKKLSPRKALTTHVPVTVRGKSENPSSPIEGVFVDYSLEGMVHKESYIQHAIQQPEFCGLYSTAGNLTHLSNDVTVGDDPTWEPKTVSPANIFEPIFATGDRVRYTGTNQLKAQVCGRKKLTIQSVADDMAVVSHDKWLVTQSIPLTDLALAK